MIISNLDDLKILDLPKNQYIPLPIGLSIEAIANHSETNKISIDRIIVELQSKKNVRPSETDLLKFEKLKANDGIYLIGKTLDEAYLDRMSFLKNGDLLSAKEYLKDAALVGDNYKIEFMGEMIGFITLRPFDHHSEPKMLISWVWSKSGLDLNLRILFKNTVLKVMSLYSNKTMIASIHLKNKRSLSFFNKLGFVPTWISLG